ncbi:FAD-dependent oxidoreductase [bacterium]|nr:FAD-dependent oxidoreductase [bacterium]
MQALTDRVYDVAIIGGGILGLSVARDCAMRRLSVVLFEREDFGAGTTGAGPGILSGEPHWLSTDPETTRIACEEINVLQRIAPNLLTRVPILYPVHKSEPKQDLDRLEALADLYDHYAVAKAGLPHVRLTGKDLRTLDPGLTDECWGAISMDEWSADPARLALAIARSAAAAGATLLKPAVVEKVEVQSGKPVGVRVSGLSDVPLLVRSRAVVNAAGPWGPGFVPKRSVEFRYYQRSYFFLERRLTDVALAIPVPRRIDPLYVFPRGGMTLIGASEVPLSGKPEDARVGSEELARTLEAVKRYFPAIESHRFTSMVTGVHCRVVATAGAEGQRQAVFDHGKEGIEGLYTLVGGGLTRARRLAEQVTNLVCKQLRQKERCRTHLEGLPGCTPEIPWREEAERSGRDPVLVAQLIRRHGHKAASILDAAARQPELAQTLCECENVVAAEAEYTIRKEWVTSLADLKRRTRLGEGSCRGARCHFAGACFLGSQLSWNGERVAEELERNPCQFPKELSWGAQRKQEEYAEYLRGFGGKPHA